MQRPYLFVVGILVTLVASPPSLAADSFTFPLGDSEITVFSEEQTEKNASILIGATPAILEKHAPQKTVAMTINAFLIRTPTQMILIDTGLGSEVLNFLEMAGIAPEQIDAILLTHMHADHIGGLVHDDQAAFPKATLHLAQQEYDYWIKDTDSATLPENARPRLANIQKALAAYAGRIHLFSPGPPNAHAPSPVPGIRAIRAYGHTPGHTLFLFETQQEKILFWGDLVHAIAVQMPSPSVAVTYDVTPEEAIVTRCDILKFVDTHKIPVAGSHVPFPGIGHISPSDSGYTFTPLQRN